MISESDAPRVQSLWPLFSSAGDRCKVDGRLLLALAWCQSGLDPKAESPAGAVGLMQMMPKTAAEVAAGLEKPVGDLTDPATSIELGAACLAPLIARFGTPQLGVAAYVAGPAAVQAAGGQVPASAEVQRTVRDVMAAWRWLTANLSSLLAEATPAPPSTTAVTSSTAMSAAAVSSVAPSWRLIVPPENWQQPVSIEVGQLAVLEEVAGRLGLIFRRDDEQYKAYLGLARPTATVPADKGRLIVPVPGATASNNGAYAADTGLDILVPFGSPVVAAGAGTIIYSEPGHTPWNQPPDTANSILIELDTPFVYQGRQYPYSWYTHLSRLRYSVPDGAGGQRVTQGETIGWTGIGNRVPHLHFGVVWDRPQTVFVPPLELAAYFGWTGH